MFIGHFAVGFAAKRLAGGVSLGLLMLAPVLLDVLWPVFCLLGIEQFHIAPGDTAYTPLAFDSYPWSHSLLMSLVWGVAYALVVQGLTGDRAGARLAGALVPSHWVLDFVTHRADMPLWPGGPRLGLGLWNSIPGTIIIESIIFVVALAIYLRATRARDRAGSIGLWSFVLLLVVSYTASSMGPIPPNQTAVLVPALIATPLCLVWVWWFDKHREVA